MEKKKIEGFEYIRYKRPQVSSEELIQKSQELFQELNQRRTVREFDTRPFPLEVMENIIRTASTAPSGAHKQPWTFCLVSDPTIKRKIREAAEKEEKISYES